MLSVRLFPLLRGRSGAASQGGGCLGCGSAAVVLLFVAFCSSLLDSRRAPSAEPYKPRFVASSVTSAQSQPRETFYIHDALNVRAGAGKEYPRLRTLTHGERVQLGPSDARGWARLYDSYGSVAGYVYRASNNVRSYAPAPRREKPSRHPAGASALCRDGTYSYSASRRGTCSWHGGVEQWL